MDHWRLETPVLGRDVFNGHHSPCTHGTQASEFTLMNSKKKAGNVPSFQKVLTLLGVALSETECHESSA